jgi:hypothetical protein
VSDLFLDGQNISGNILERHFPIFSVALQKHGGFLATKGRKMVILRSEICFLEKDILGI